MLEKIFPHEADDRSLATWAFCVWVAVFLVATVYALIQPVWSVVDEGPHFGYVELLAEHGKLPRAGDTVVSERVLAIGRDRQWGWQYPRDPALVLEVEKPPQDLPERDMSQWVRENLWRFNYEAVQPPAYYAAAALVYRLTPGSTIAKLYGIRIFSAFLASLAVVFAYRIARRIAPGSRFVILGAPLTFLFLQGYLLNNSQITNDALAAPMGGMLALVALYLWQEPPQKLSAARLLLGGAAVGIAALTKSVLWYFVPLLCALTLVRFGIQPGLSKLRVASISFGLLFVPWLARNLVVYGEATGQSRMARFLGAFFPAPRVRDLRSLWEYVFGSTKHMVLTYIWGEPAWVWAWKQSNQILAVLAWSAIASGIAIWLLRRRRRTKGTHLSSNQTPKTLEEPDHVAEKVEKMEETEDAGLPKALLVLATTVATGYVFMLALPLLGGIAVVGRYMYPLSAPIAAVAAFGISNLAPQRRPRLKLLVGGLLLAAFVVANVVNLASWGSSGRATSRVSDGVTYLEPVTGPARTWYFAPGRNEGGFVDLLYVFNPNEIAATVDFTYFPGGRVEGARRLVVMPQEGLTINTRFDRAGGYGAGHLSLGVVVTSDVPIVAARGAFFFVTDRSWTGGTISAGTTEPVTEAYFPAGRTGDGYSEALSFLNISDREARVSIEYVADGRSVERTLPVKPRSPQRVEVGGPEKSGGLGEPSSHLSVIVRSSEPIVVQRQLYYAAEGVSGGEWSNPAKLSSSGVFPAVTSGSGYQPTLVVYNPHAEAVTLKLWYRFSDGSSQSRELVLPRGRSDIDLDVPFDAGVGAVSGPYALAYEANAELAAELEMTVRDGAFSDALIEPPLMTAANRWHIPFATTNPDFATTIVLYNPSDEAVRIDLTYWISHLSWLPSAQNPEIRRSLVLEARQTLRFDVRSDPMGISSTQDFALTIEAQRPIYAGGLFYFVHAF